MAKQIKMLRTVERTDGKNIGDVCYTVADSQADAMIAAGDAELVAVLPDESPAEEKAADIGEPVSRRKKK